MADWTGNTNSIFKTLGSSNHVSAEREENDYYATDPKAVEMLLDMHRMANDIWEPACGEGHLSKVLEALGHYVVSSDLIDRGYGESGVDFLSSSTKKWDGDIITNPPYKYAKEFILQALRIIKPGRQAAFFLKVLFMESKDRKDLFALFPPKVIYISSNRIECGKNGKFGGSKAVAYAWYVWEKGFQGDTIIKWFN